MGACFPSKHSSCGFKIAQNGAARKMTLHNDITFNDLASVARGYILNCKCEGKSAKTIAIYNTVIRYFV